MSAPGAGRAGSRRLRGRTAGGGGSGGGGVGGRWRRQAAMAEAEAEAGDDGRCVRLNAERAQALLADVDTLLFDCDGVLWLAARRRCASAPRP